MRTIKFRAKRIDDTNQFEYGYIRVDGTDVWMHTLDGRVMLVIHETVGQFTGLHDKNGKEIYEGDIICSFDSKGNKILHIVKYEESDAAFITFLVMDNGVLSRTGGIYSGWIAEFEKEVVGNIHDTKLEDKK